MSKEERASEAVDEAAHVLGLLAEPGRLRVAAAVVLGQRDVHEISRACGLPRRAVEQGLARLVVGGLVEHDRNGYRFVADELIEVVRRLADARREQEPDVPIGSDVVRRFFKRGRLTSIPATRGKRLAILDHLAQSFEPGRRYPESIVNATLARFHEDVASLRRYLVDEGFMERDHGVYWRAGGTFDVH